MQASLSISGPASTLCPSLICPLGRPASALYWRLLSLCLQSVPFVACKHPCPSAVCWRRVPCPEEPCQLEQPCTIALDRTSTVFLQTRSGKGKLACGAAWHCCICVHPQTWEHSHCSQLAAMLSLVLCHAGTYMPRLGGSSARRALAPALEQWLSPCNDLGGGSSSSSTAMAMPAPMTQKLQLSTAATRDQVDAGCPCYTRCARRKEREGLLVWSDMALLQPCPALQQRSKPVVALMARLRPSAAHRVANTNNFCSHQAMSLYSHTEV